MRNITKTETPGFWIDLIKKNPRLKYADLEPVHKHEKDMIKAHMLQNEQFYLCCYCCKRIDQKQSHIEHVKPRQSFPKLSMDYQNLLISCTGKTCGVCKDRQVLPDSLSYRNWESRFAYTVDGRIVPSFKEDGDVEKAIQILNLNDRTLIDGRKEVYDECVRYAKWMGKSYVKEMYLDMDNGKMPRFSPMVAYFYELGHFDEDVVNAAE